MGSLLLIKGIFLVIYVLGVKGNVISNSLTKLDTFHTENVLNAENTNVNCSTVKQGADGTVQIIKESGYNCTDNASSKNEYKTDVRLKRQAEEELDTGKPIFKKVAIFGLQYFIQKYDVPTGLYLKPTVIRVTKFVEGPNDYMIQVDFIVINIQDSSEQYACYVRIGTLVEVPEFGKTSEVYCAPKTEASSP